MMLHYTVQGLSILSVEIERQILQTFNKNTNKLSRFLKQKFSLYREVLIFLDHIFSGQCEQNIKCYKLVKGCKKKLTDQEH